MNREDLTPINSEQEKDTFLHKVKEFRQDFNTFIEKKHHR